MNKKLYTVWYHMHRRCSYKNDIAWARYGGRGITVCLAWSNFVTFKEWALASGWSHELTLERNDNNSGYSPDNCKWTSMKEQNSNKSNVSYVTIDGITKPRYQWCDELGISRTTVSARINSFGWDAVKALTTPVSTAKGLSKYCK